MDVSVLAKSLTLILSPVLPYLWPASGTVLKGVGNKVGEDVWARAKTIWAKLHPKIAAKSSAQEAVEDLIKDPENEDAQAAFRHQLKKLLSQDLILAGALNQLLPEEKQNPATTNIQQQAGDNSVQIGTGGQGNTIELRIREKR